ncbi:hypothetical protein J4E89_008201 [Alternaria sp. Ai002NY15]|nr:hypothetical protein J4E89_008201 [Alternaria sp. Ai002NY15]
MNIQVLDSLAKYQHDRMPSIAMNSFSKLTPHTQEALYHPCEDEVIRDFKTSQTQLKSLLHLLENRKHLLKDILQYRSVKANEDTATKTRQEATSMKVITSVTLFFLPATFIATFMSTNIVSYENGNSNIETGGLKTYLAITLPLTALTFLAWYVIYRYARETGFSRGRGRHEGENGQQFV